MRFRLPFVWAVHYTLRGSTVTNENLPWKIVLARTASDAARKFEKKHPAHTAKCVFKI